MGFVLAIDGGGSGCRAAVALRGGAVLGRGTGGPANIAADPDGARRAILGAARAALAAAGDPCAPGDLDAVLGLAGANAPGAADRLRGALPFAASRIESDAVTAAAGALGPGDGVVAALGTGSVFAAQRGGRIRQIGGWGLALGDEGSGAWIGRALLARALRADDGLVAQTPLLRAVAAEHGGPPGIVALSLAARGADYAALAPRVAGSDDPAARAIMRRAARDVAASIAALRGEAPLPVVFLGGLGPTYARLLAGRWPVSAPLGTGLDGALRLAGAAP